MKEYFVSKGGVGIYYDNKDATDIPMMSVTQDVIKEKWNQTCKEITTNGKKKIVMIQKGSLLLCVVSDEDESSTSLRYLLDLFYDLMQFRMNINTSGSFYNKSMKLDAQKVLRPISKAMTRLTTTYQSILVQGIERVQVNDVLLKELKSVMENQTKKCNYLQHAILLVGVQVAEIYSRSKSWNLQPKDLLLLIIYVNSIQDEIEAEFEKKVEEEKIKDEEEKEIIKEKLYEKKGIPRIDELYFHKYSEPSKCIVQTHHFKSNITLVLICDEQQDPEELLTASEKINESLKSWESFLVVKAQHAHISMLHFTHYCPGLIHFIFIDRITNKVIAPKITSLNTKSDETNDSKNIEVLKNQIWNMATMMIDYREQGYSEVGIVETKVQYWHKEWFEDETGVERLGLTKSQVKSHYELYTMYLSYISTEYVVKYNKILVQLLLDPNFLK